MDEKHILKLWNSKKSMLMSTLNQDMSIQSIRGLSFANSENKLAIRDSRGITFWNLQQKIPNLGFGNFNIGYSKMAVLKCGSKLVFAKGKSELIEIDIKNNMQYTRHIELPKKTKNLTIVGNGDAIFTTSALSADKGQAAPSFRSKKSKRASTKCFKLCFVDLKSISGLENSETTTMKTHESGNGYIENRPGFYELIRSQEEISVFNLISNKGFKPPLVFENQKVENRVQFYTELDEGVLWKGLLHIGRGKGDCFVMDFHVDEGGQLCKTERQVFKQGEPVSKLKKQKSKIELEDKTRIDVLDLDKEGTAAVVKKNFRTHDFKRLLEEEMEIAVISKQLVTAAGTQRLVYVYAKTVGKSEWTYTKFSARNKFNFNKSNFFKVRRMKNPHSERQVDFFLVSKVGIAVLRFRRTDNELRVLSFLKKYIPKAATVCYSLKENLFYIPIKNRIEIWNKTLKFSKYNIQFDSKVLGAYLAENDTAQRLLAYDDSSYYEIDLVDLKVRRKDAVVQAGTGRAQAMSFNLNLFPKNTLFEVPYFKEKISSISFIEKTEALDLKEFPFEILINCFEKESYLFPIKDFAAYYFRKIAQLNYEDTVYGPISPLFFAIYHNNMGLLKQLLGAHRYPTRVREYWSPLVFAFIHQYNSAVKVFCDQLMKRDYAVSFTRTDFKFLLKSPFSYCHKLMATIPSEPTLQNFPKLLFMKEPVKLFYIEEVGHLLFFLKEEEHQILKKSSKKTKLKGVKLVSKGLLKSNSKQVNPLTKREVVSFQIPFKYSYGAGTPDSVEFLDTYSQSNTEEFILSQWKEVIIDKWRSHRLMHVFLAFLYWVFTIVATLSVVFFKRTLFLQIGSLSFISFFILFEILQLISYSAFKIKRLEEG